jgi:hypothetical protein
MLFIQIRSADILTNLVQMLHMVNKLGLEPVFASDGTLIRYQLSCQYFKSNVMIYNCGVNELHYQERCMYQYLVSDTLCFNLL